MQTVRTKNNGNRFIEQYEWTIGVCITVQIGERGTCTDVQIGERGKQRVKQSDVVAHCHCNFMLAPKLSLQLVLFLPMTKWSLCVYCLFGDTVVLENFFWSILNYSGNKGKSVGTEHFKWTYKPTFHQLYGLAYTVGHILRKRRMGVFAVYDEIRTRR